MENSLHIIQLQHWDASEKKWIGYRINTRTKITTPDGANAEARAILKMERETDPTYGGLIAAHAGRNYRVRIRRVIVVDERVIE